MSKCKNIGYSVNFPPRDSRFCPLPSARCGGRWFLSLSTKVGSPRLWYVQIVAAVVAGMIEVAVGVGWKLRREALKHSGRHCSLTACSATLRTVLKYIKYEGEGHTTTTVVSAPAWVGGCVRGRIVLSDRNCQSFLSGAQ